MKERTEESDYLKEALSRTRESVEVEQRLSHTSKSKQVRKANNLGKAVPDDDTRAPMFL